MGDQINLHVDLELTENFEGLSQQGRASLAIIKLQSCFGKRLAAHADVVAAGGDHGLHHRFGDVCGIRETPVRQVDKTTIAFAEFQKPLLVTWK